VETFTGVGTPPPQHSVNLSWTASTSPNISGYNIYRGTKSGGPYSKINAVLNASTVYTDTTVADGQTYYYVTTAVNSSNEESAYSNQATAVIPPP
jgi:fibronectin type 3 domain-containing protein